MLSSVPQYAGNDCIHSVSVLQHPHCLVVVLNANLICLIFSMFIQPLLLCITVCTVITVFPLVLHASTEAMC